MVSEKYRNAFSEVSIILEHLRKEDYNKISKETIDAIEKNKNNDYEFVLQDNVELKDQNLMPETRAILFNLFYDFYADNKQKSIIHDIWRAERRKEELEKQGKYDVDVFKNNNSSNNEIVFQTDQVALTTKENDNILIRIFNKIKNIFRKK